MATNVPSDLLRAVWEYPLFDALYGRRTRRFGLGFEMAQEPYQYRSSQPPVPLCEDEEALLVTAGIGFSGMALWDQSRPLPYRNSDGRTFPSTARGRRTALFFTNDRGVHVIDPSAGSAGQMREADSPDGWAAVLDLYHRHRLTLQQRRLDIPRRVPPPLRAQFVGLEHARIDAVHPGLRCHFFADRSDRAICRPQARTFRAGKRTRHQHRRRPVWVSAGRHRGLDQERVAQSRRRPGVKPLAAPPNGVTPIRDERLQG
jgi:hypothetical protein